MNDQSVNVSVVEQLEERVNGEAVPSMIDVLPVDIKGALHEGSVTSIEVPSLNSDSEHEELSDTSPILELESQKDGCNTPASTDQVHEGSYDLNGEQAINKHLPNSHMIPVNGDPETVGDATVTTSDIQIAPEAREGKKVDNFVLTDSQARRDIEATLETVSSQADTLVGEKVAVIEGVKPKEIGTYAEAIIPGTPRLETNEVHSSCNGAHPEFASRSDNDKTNELNVGNALEATISDLEQIWQWNRDLPPNIDRCMHDIIAEKMIRDPDRPAVLSWDGELTYGELDRISSRIALRLMKLGMGVGAIIPLCFEKSMWTVVAVLAVMRAGAGFVLTDPQQPEARLRTIATEVAAGFILTSTKQAELGSRIAPTANIIVVGPELGNSTETLEFALPQVPASAILYVIFTSGSTGKPKGVVISHSNYTSGAIPRAEAVFYKSNSRVLDFASYAFDVSIDCMLCTLSQGGCICVPSDEARVNDLSGAIRSMNVNMAHMTPSVARVLAADVFPSLDVLGLGGESVSAGDAKAWGLQTKVIIAYGPSECTVGCTINNSITSEKSYTSIGKGVGGSTWIVDPEDHNLLTPIGGIGELLVEGPIVGVGYLNEPDKIAVVFIEDPVWLIAGNGSLPGRQGRLYKTGDLVKYDPDGSGDIVFVGRKDRQVKLRGQRVELAEIEHHLRKKLPADASVAAEVITPGSKTREPTLVAFIAEGKETQNPSNNDGTVTSSFSDELQRSLADVDSALGAELPTYMVPTAYIPLPSMPLLVSCKVDRKRLQEIGLSITPQQLAKFRIVTVDNHKPSTVIEQKLYGLWAQLFGEDVEIGTNDNFFALGGDSLKAMKLVAIARLDGISLTVAIIFTHPTLSEMALAAGEVSTEVEVEIPAFSLLKPSWNADAASAEVAKLCNIDISLVEDIYPCTPLQEGLMALSAKISEAYIAQRVVNLADIETAKALRAAFESVADESPILRTRVVQVPGKGLMQVVVKGVLAWFEGNELNEYLRTDREGSMGLGEPLARFAVISDDKSGKFHLVLTIHHALYDGWSMPLVIERVSRAYRGLTLEKRTPFKAFIKYLTTSDRIASEKYWTERLQGANGPQFPNIPYPGYQAQSDSLLEHFVSLKKSSSSTIIVATAIRGAWAIVAAAYLGTDNVVFGETLTGRNAPVPGIEQIEGPLITTVPVRVHVDRNAKTSDFLEGIHGQTLLRIPHEHMGLQHIRRLSPDAREACELKTGLVLHPNTEAADNTAIVDEPANGLVPAGDEEAAREALKFSSYPLMLVCSLGPHGFLTMASFDSNTVDVPLMEKILVVFGRVVQQLCETSESRVGDLLLVDEQETTNLKTLSSLGPASLVSVEDNALDYDASAVFATWVVDPTDPERLVPSGAIGELLIESSQLPTLPSIENPKWHTGSGSPTQLFKTGKLARYNSAGSIIFAGKKSDSPSSQVEVPVISVEKTSVTLVAPLQADLLRLWSRVLGIPEDEINSKDSFFDLGGDSIGAMKLVSDARMEGLEFTVAQVFKYRRLHELANIIIKKGTKTIQELVKKPSDPFSALDSPHTNAFLAAVVYPTLANPEWNIVDVLPARPLQDIAVQGTTQLPRYSARYELIYLEAGVDRKRLFKSCQDLVSKNEILRTVFIRHESKCYSVILEDLTVAIDSFGIEGDLEDFSRKLCDLDVQTKMPLGSAFVKFFFVQGEDGCSTLIFKISHALYDEICLPPLLHQLSALYENRPLIPSIPFSNFAYHVINTNIPQSIPYWQDLLKGSSLTVLRPSPPLTTRTPMSLYRTFDISSRSREVTVATIPTAAWALCLARHLSLMDVTFGEVVSGRNIDFPNSDTVIGPCWQYIPLRVKFQPHWTALDLLEHVQQQHISSARFEGMGLKEIVSNCTDWAGSTDWFDSVVHQDVAHVESLQFLGREGKMETFYPHLEPLREWKVQAFHKGDELGIEIVTFEDWRETAEGLMGEIGGIIEGLVGRCGESLFPGVME